MKTHQNKESKYFWRGIKHDIPLCCILFFESVWTKSIKQQISEYGKTMSELTKNQGIILCPDCVIKKVTAVSTRTKSTVIC